MLVAAGVVLGVVLALSGGDDDEGGGPPATTTTTGTVPPQGEELLDRLELARSRSLHVVLSSDPATVAATGQDLTVELWRTSDGQVRQDLILGAGELRSETRSLQTANGDYFCQRAAEADWICQEIRSVATEEGEPGGLVEAAAGDLQGADVATTDTEILGRAARCYEIESAEGSQSSLCLSDDGTPLRLGVQGQVLTATVVDEELPDDVFQLPAEPTTAPITTAAAS